MPWPKGTKLGQYEVAGPLGKGGMGEVYRARDSKLSRDVALKLLPPDLASDAERLARLRREARALASCNHPNIAAIHDLVESKGATFLVLELVEGRTLESVLRASRMPTDRALRIARQIAGALELAHERGVVHRDLKPANVMLGDRDEVKVLDFGLARSRERKDVPASEDTETLTRSAALTVDGAIMGTVPYMSPEQLRGAGVDHRTDIWAFGCVLYELFTGKHTFSGSTTVELAAAILESEPDLSALDGVAPESVRRLVRRCLQKSPDRRLQHMGDARIELEEAQERPQAAQPARPGRRGLAWLGWLVAIVAVAVALVSLLRGGRGPSTGADSLRFLVPLPESTALNRGEAFTSLAVSPDGRHLAFTSGGLWLHSFADGVSRRLDGTDGATNPIWAPDSRSVAFVASGEIRKIPIEGGPTAFVADASLDGGISWGGDDTILFSQSGPTGRGIYAVSGNGGEVRQLTHLDPERELAHFWPQLLPDGERFLCVEVTREGSDVSRTLVARHVETGAREVIAPLASRFLYAAPGWMFFVAEGALVAQRFDAETLTFSGTPILVDDRLHYFFGTGLAEFGVSSGESGIVVATHGGPPEGDLVWHDRSGTPVTMAEAGSFGAVRISPSGERTLVDVWAQANGGRDLWVYRLSDSAPRRLTYSPSDEAQGVWFPGEERIAFRADTFGPPDIFTLASDGSETPEPLLQQIAVLEPEDISPDGRELLFIHYSRSTGTDIWRMPLDAEADPEVFVKTPFDEWGARYSPDGRWVAFVSDESGRSEVYLAAEGTPGARTPISVEGGTAPRWREDGRELLFLASGSRVMSARVDWRDEPVVSAPVELFRPEASIYRTFWDVQPDGERFLLNLVRSDARREPIEVVSGWQPPEDRAGSR